MFLIAFALKWALEEEQLNKTYTEELCTNNNALNEQQKNILRFRSVAY